MTDRTVVCLRWRPARPDASDRDGFARILSEYYEAAIGCRGRVIAWQGDSVAFDFDSLEDALEVLRGSAGGDAWLAPDVIAGIAQGEIALWKEPSPQIVLATGPALHRAMALARIARKGEILVDPIAYAVLSGELLTRGARLGILGGERVRGLALDQRFPWRGELADSIERLVSAPRIGGPVSSLAITPGTLTLVVAEHGLGGTRALEDCASATPHFWVLPGAAGEPLGALRHSFELWRAKVTMELAASDAESLTSLLVGEGLDRDGVAALIAATFGEAAQARAVFIDDMDAMDIDSLEALAIGCREHALALVARITHERELPSPFATLARAPVHRLTALLPTDAARLARAFTHDALSEKDSLRWAKQAAGVPLAIRESLRVALVHGDLVWTEKALLGRVRSAGRGRACSAEHWLRRRLGLLDPEVRGLLDALAVFGGVAAQSEVGALLERLGEDAAALAREEEGLIRQGFIRRVTSGIVALDSATLRDLLLGELGGIDRTSFHEAASAVLEDTRRPLAAAAAATHALLAGDSRRAAELARQAASSLQAVGLSETAVRLTTFAETLDTTELHAQGLLGALRAERRSVRPPALHTTSPSGRVRALGGIERVSLVSELSGESEAQVSSKAAAALREGDLETVEAIIAQIRDGADPEQQRLADRLNGMLSLARGATGEALRLLRAAKQSAKECGPADRSRAALAHGIGLAAAGRVTEALLEALEGLARAREAVDERGERACARFVAQLARGAGHEQVAQAWQDLARP